MAQCSAIGVSVAATPPCSAIRFQEGNYPATPLALPVRRPPPLQSYVFFSLSRTLRIQLLQGGWETGATLCSAIGVTARVCHQGHIEPKHRFSQLFTDSRFSTENEAFGKRRFSQETVDFRRNLQKTSATRRKPQIGVGPLRFVPLSAALSSSHLLRDLSQSFYWPHSCLPPKESSP